MDAEHPHEVPMTTYSLCPQLARLLAHLHWHRTHCARLLALGISLAILLGAAQPVQGRVNVVTLPGRDTVQLTIYNSVDLTLAKETRVLTFRKGLNRLEFSWANTLIDPTSVEFRALSHVDEVEVLDVSFPPRVSNTLEWRISSEIAGEVTVEIRYFTSGISWSADYVGASDRQEKAMTFAGNVRVNNKSGEDYDNAQVRLVVGVIRLVEDIAELARRKTGATNDSAMTQVLQETEEKQKTTVYFAFGGAAMAASGKRAEIIKEGVSEYFLYTVEGRDTIRDGWSKRLPSFGVSGVPLTSYYKYERERWADQVMRYYRFTNSVPANLGKEPLPDGAVKMFRVLNPEGLYGFVGSTSVKYIPVNETVEMELGTDREVQVKPKLMNWAKTGLQFDGHGDVKGWTVKENWTVEVQNSKEIEVVVDLRRNFGGDWTLATEAAYEKVDANKVKFVLPLKAGEERKVSYELTTRYGTSVTR